MPSVKEKSNKILSKIQKVREAAALTKQTLIGKWNESKAFVDMDSMDSPGLVSEAVGLTSLLLLLLAFNEDENVISEEDRREIANLHKESLNKIYERVTNYGYTADPLVDCDSTDAVALFCGNNAGYVDTLTWVLSVSILSRRVDLPNDNNDLGGIIRFDDKTRKQYLELMVDSLERLLKAQREDGMWGFNADTESSASLYFTYSACASLADFFDYVLGEIAYTYSELSDEDMEKEKIRLTDKTLIKHLDTTLGFDVTKAVENAREKVQTWLIETCMFDMPTLATCEDMNGAENEEFRARLGMWDHTPEGKDKDLREFVRYYNLNYTYFLVDMMVSMSVDKRFAVMCNGSERARLIDLCRSHLSKNEANYYLGKDGSGKKINELWKNAMEQTIHTARAQFMQASRTGAKFWNRAELPIQWVHEEDEVIEQIRNVHDSKKFKDPSIVPMALRANTMFCYYISEQPDMSVDRLFNDILNERANQNSELKNTIAGLWDGEKYSLLITERSVESIVDYYDYLNKFEATELDHTKYTGDSPVDPPPAKSEFDVLLEKKIAEYLASEEGKEVITRTVGATPPADSTINIQAVIDYVTELNTIDVDGQLLNTNASNPAIQLMISLGKLFNQLQNLQILQFVHEANKKSSLGMKADEEKKAMEAVSMQIKQLLSEIVAGGNWNSQGKTLAMLYQILLESANK